MENDKKNQPAVSTATSSQLWNVLENIADAFIILDTAWNFTYINKKAGRLFRRNHQYLAGKHIWTELPELQRSLLLPAFEKAAQTGNYTVVEEYYYNMSHCWLCASVYPSPNGLFVFIKDITRIKQAETALQKSEEKYRLLIEQALEAKRNAEIEFHKSTAHLRELSDHLQNIREIERTNIAREIHDELGQQLTILKMDVSWLQKQLKDYHNDAVVQRTKDTIQLLNETIKTVRRIATELRPSMLDDLGLVTAIEWQSKEFENRAGIKVTFESNITHLYVEGTIATSLFRIYQEALTNIARHAKATQVYSNLQVTNDTVMLTIRDDGQGFDMRTLAGKRTLGILGMQERALMIKGRFEITSEEGKGTNIVVTTSLQNETPAPEQE